MTKKAIKTPKTPESAPVISSAPRPGFTSKAIVTNTHDGDTWEVELRRRFSIRIIHPGSKLEFNTPELFTKEGKIVAEKVKEMFEGKEVLIFIPAGKNDLQLFDINSFNRLLGEIWDDGQSVTDVMLEKNFGKLYKPGTYETKKKST